MSSPFFQRYGSDIPIDQAPIGRIDPADLAVAVSGASGPGAVCTDLIEAQAANGASQAQAEVSTRSTPAALVDADFAHGARGAHAHRAVALGHGG